MVRPETRPTRPLQETASPDDRRSTAQPSVVPAAHGRLSGAGGSERQNRDPQGFLACRDGVDPGAKPLCTQPLPWFVRGLGTSGGTGGPKPPSERRADPGARSGGAERLGAVCERGVLPGSRRDQPLAASLDERGGGFVVSGVVGHREAGEGVFLAVPGAAGELERGVPGARPGAVLRVFRGHAAADVLPDRRLGRGEAGVRGDQVLAVHAVRVGLHPGGDPAAVFLVERSGQGAVERRSSPILSTH